MPSKPQPSRVTARDFLHLSPELRASALGGRACAEIARLIEEAAVGILVADAAFRIVALNRKARPTYANLPKVIGMSWAEIIRSHWETDAAEDIIAAITNTLKTGAPYSSIGFSADRIDVKREERYHWEVHRLNDAAGEQMLICYFVGPLG